MRFAKQELLIAGFTSTLYNCSGTPLQRYPYAERSRGALLAELKFNAKL